MTVKQLVQRLIEMDQDASVIVEINDLCMVDNPIIGSLIDPEKIEKKGTEVVITVYSI